MKNIYSSETDEIREILLKKVGIKLNTEMGGNNLYLTTYHISKKFKNNMNNVKIVSTKK